MDDDFINNVTQMVYEDYEANKTIMDHLGRKALLYEGPSSIQTKSWLLGPINLLLRIGVNGFISQ